MEVNQPGGDHLAGRVDDVRAVGGLDPAADGGLGIGLLSRYIVGLDANNPEICALDVEGFPVMQQWFMAHPKGRQLPQVAAAFLDYVRANADSDVLTHLECAHAGQHGAAEVADKLIR